MRNPFQKQNNTALVATISISALTAGTMAFLFLTEEGENIRGNLLRAIKEQLKNKAADLINRKTIIPQKVAKIVADHLAQ
ncbi:MAG: hypothetical protein V4560_20035 [Bacteroidota bacterium]